MNSILDQLFVAYLVLLSPAWALWTSLGSKGEPARDDTDPAAKDRRFRKNMRLVGLPLLVLWALFAWTGRPATLLGLDIPVSPSGLWGIATVCVLIAGVIVGTMIWERRLNALKTAEYHAKLRKAGILPGSRRELVQFVLLMILMGTGWELLYRGYLMLVLPPAFGTQAAVAIAALAYGAGHGYSNWKQFVGSIVAAFLFTIGYVFTGSLWWLMLLHVSLPLTGMVSAKLSLSSRVAANDP